MVWDIQQYAREYNKLFNEVTGMKTNIDKYTTDANNLYLKPARDAFQPVYDAVEASCNRRALVFEILEYEKQLNDAKDELSKYNLPSKSSITGNFCGH